MSVVRRAHDPVLQRDTALKKLAPRHLDLEEARRRFLDEARITGTLEHPHIVPVYDYGQSDDGRDFMMMKLVEGATLGDRIREQGDDRLDPDVLASNLEILLKVCDAVSFAHHRGVVHRDLKPSNVMVGEFGEVYVVDWGIAVREGDPLPDRAPDTTVGTPSCMAPEQIEDPDGVDARADVYALGGILYRLLTGRPPHHGKSPLARMTVALYGRVRPPQDVVDDPRLPMALVRVCERALAKDPEDRYPSVKALRADLEGFLRGAWSLPVRRVAAGQTVVREGDAGREAFVIRSGRCQVHSEGAGHIRELGPGDVFGELAILAERPRTATITAITEVELMVVDRSVLEEGLGLNSWMGRFVRALATRFADLESELLADGC
jgi:serine/threonine-protein kinase